MRFLAFSHARQPRFSEMAGGVALSREVFIRRSPLVEGRGCGEAPPVVSYEFVSPSGDALFKCLQELLILCNE